MAMVHILPFELPASGANTTAQPPTVPPTVEQSTIEAEAHRYFALSRLAYTLSVLIARQAALRVTPAIIAEGEAIIRDIATMGIAAPDPKAQPELFRSHVQAIVAMKRRIEQWQGWLLNR